MVYIENNTELQEVWIPKNDGTGSSHKPTKELEGVDVTISQDITVVHPSSGYYGMSAVTIDASEYGQSNYDEGFDDGYTDGYSSGTSDGEQSIIDTFTSTTITINGQYGSSANPYSSVTVDVAQTGHTDQELQEAYESGYTSGSTDGYNSGYTSGETHQKSLLGTTAFTINGSYSAENGYSAITVNVPTGQTYNIEENHPFTATSNGDYTITPSSGITTITDRFDSDDDRYYLSATASCYPSVGRYNLFYIEDEFDSSKGQIDVYIENGYLDYDDSDWYGGEVVDLSVDRNIDLFIRNANRNFEWYPLEDFNYHYDAMSAVTLAVNVETASTYQSGYTSGYTDGYDSGSTDGFNSGYTSGTTDGYASGYTSGTTDGFNSGYTSGYTSGHTDGVDEEKAKMSAVTFTANTAVTLSDGSYSAVTVNVPQSGGSGVKYVEYIETDGTYIGFDFSTAHTYSSLDETICLDFMPLNGTVYSDTYYGFMGAENMLLWTIPYGYRVNDKYGLAIGDFNMYYGWSSGPTFSAGTRFDCAFSSTGATINNVDYPFTITSVGTPGYIKLNWNGDISNPRCPVARYYGFKIMSGDTVICNYRPAIDNNGTPCFYEETTGEYYYKNPICSGTPIAGPALDPSYASGYTDGQNSIINTFTAMTATTNGIYGSSANPLTAITVNVPQSGSNITYVEWIATSTLTENTTTGLIDTGVIPTTGTTFRVKGIHKGLSQNTVVVGYKDNDNKDYRLFWHTSTGQALLFDFNTSRIGEFMQSFVDGFEVDLICGNNYVMSGTTSAIIASGQTQTSVQDPHTIKLDVGSWYVKSLEIWDGETKVFDGQASYDGNGHIGLYDSISQSMVYNSALTMTYGNILPSADYQSGYTDGYASGYTDGSASIASLIDRSITEVVIPSGVKKIGDQAFASCQNLKSITIPNSVTSINNNAFYGCYSLSSITIPSGVTLLGGNCFYNNYALSSITIPNSVTYLGSSVFYSCQALTSVTFSNSLTVIPSSCCNGCKLLPNVTIPNTITTIDNYSFQNCSALTEVNIGSGVTTINSNAFKNCITLANIYISATTAPTIANANAFQGVPSTGTVHYPQGSDYSSWQSNQYLSGWTFVGDL